MDRPASAILHGIVPVIPTPFRADESIDFEALEASVRFAAACEVGAICLPAYASEFYKLSDQERLELVQRAIAAANRRVAVVAQANHGSARVAASVASQYERLGASVIAVALPRQFNLREQDLIEYARQICEATTLPVLVQDYHPNGSCVAGEFSARLHEACPNFRFLKIEEPMAGFKVRDIIRATNAEVGVLEGWGGMYMMELIYDGIIGVMPGLGIADLLKRVWDMLYRAEREAAMDLFQSVLPQITFAIQNFEFWLFVEKQMLAARGVIPDSSAFRRGATHLPDPAAVRHALWLNQRLVHLLDRLELPRNPGG